MKKTILLFAFVLCTLFTQARNTIHWITFVDTTSDIGEYNINTQRVLYSKWIDVISSALAEKGYQSVIHRFEGANTSPKNCRAIAEKICANKFIGEDDIIVFYYIGHGGRNHTTPSDYPLMALAEPACSPGLCVSLKEEVHDKFKKTGARLTITIGMCCNSYMDRIEVEKGASIAIPKSQGAVSLSIEEKTNIQKLFLNYKGDIIVASSKPGQVSWLGYILDFGLGDFFSYHLFKVFKEHTSKTYFSDWESILSDVQVKVNNYTLERSLRPDSKVTEQTPIFDINIDHAPEPNVKFDDNVIGRKTIEMDANIAEADLFNQQLTAAFDLVINPYMSRAKRRELAKGIQKRFATDATIRVYGQDIDVVIDKDDLDSFFSRLTFTNQLLKVKVVKCTLDSSGKIEQLYIKEYYNK